MTKFKTLTYFKFKVFSLLTILFLGFFLAGCGGGGGGDDSSSVGSSGNGGSGSGNPVPPVPPVPSTTYSISFYNENLDFIAIKQIEKGVDISDVEPYSTTWFKANEVSQLKTFDFNTNIRVYAVSNVQEITTQEELGNVRNKLNGKYILLNDIALAEGKAGLDNINGWTPIGDFSNRFTGIFNGNGYKITNVWINKPSDGYYIGLFGYIENAQIRNLGLKIAEGKEIKGHSQVGGIAGFVSRGRISNSYTIGNVNGTNIHVGGIVGYASYVDISNSYAIGNISGSGDFNVGGIAGYAYGSNISNNYAIGNISGSDDNVGGIAGLIHISNIFNSYATGNIKGSTNVGGIAGRIYDSSNIFNSYSIGNINGGYGVGGIAGLIHEHSNIFNSYSTGNVNGNYAGGIVGSIHNSSSIFNGYSTVNISGRYFVGGIAGYAENSKISNSYSTANIGGYGYYVGGITGAINGATIQNNVAINPSIAGMFSFGSAIKPFVNRVIGAIDGGGNSINNFASIDIVGSFSDSGYIEYHGIDKTVDLLKNKNTYLSGGLGWKFGNDVNNPWVWGAFSDYPYPTFYWQVQKP
jgi:hypothetical protein